MRKITRLLIWWVVGSLVAAGVLLLWSWPWRPQSARGWTFFLFAALPVLFLVEYVAERILDNPFARRLDALGPGAKASVERIAYAVLCFVAVYVLVLCAFALLSKTGWLGAL